MEKLNIVSMMKINGEWVNQEEIPPEKVKGIIQETFEKACRNIGFQISKGKNHLMGGKGR